MIDSLTLLADLFLEKIAIFILEIYVSFKNNVFLFNRWNKSI